MTTDTICLVSHQAHGDCSHLLRVTGVAQLGGELDNTEPKENVTNVRAKRAVWIGPSLLIWADIAHELKHAAYGVSRSNLL